MNAYEEFWKVVEGRIGPVFKCYEARRTAKLLVFQGTGPGHHRQLPLDAIGRLVFATREEALAAYQRDLQSAIVRSKVNIAEWETLLKLSKSLIP